MVFFLFPRALTPFGNQAPRFMHILLLIWKGRISYLLLSETIPWTRGSVIVLGDLTYHITNKGKSKPFHKVSQGLLNGKLLQTPAVDCTVHYSRLYGPLQRTIQSAAGDCSNSTYGQA